MRTGKDPWQRQSYLARRLDTLSGLAPYEIIAKIRTSESNRFIVDPIHQMPGPNT